MEKTTYQQIYLRLKSPKHIQEISQEFSICPGIIFNILHQKIVHNVRKNHRKIVQKAPLLAKSWRKGNTFLEIACQNDFPPVLIASILLKEMGYKSKSVIKNPEIVQNGRLRKEIIQAIENDFSYSPAAQVIQRSYGRMGEEFIYKWLKAKDLNFLTESDLNKKPNTKTPDFLLHKSLDVNGSQVKWIESKAVFADEKEHNRYQKKQYRFYEDIYGPGMVVYWYGFLDTIVPGNYIITDYMFFENLGIEIGRLLNHPGVY